jgi:ribosomal-protein-alanine N-acetyltransferase
VTLANLYLEPLTPHDLDAAIALDRLCLGGMWSLAGYQREIASPNSDLLVLRRDIPPSPTLQASSENGEVEQEQALLIGLGCAWRIVDEAHITLICVHPHYQRQGLGQLLLHGLLTCAVQAQMSHATLEVKEGNRAAIALYQQFGFREVGRRKEYYQATQEDALIFWRRGLQAADFAVELNAWRDRIMCRLLRKGWQCSNWMPPLQIS